MSTPLEIFSLPNPNHSVLDWKSSDDRKRFLASPEFTNLYKQWQSCPVSFQSSSPSLFALTPSVSARENVFGLATKYPYPPGPCVSVLVTFHFSPSFDFSKIHVLDGTYPARTKEKAWEGTWVSFRQNALKSEGGIVSSGNADGWGVDEKSFIGVFRFMDLETAQKFFAEAQNDNPSHLGGIQRLWRLADREVVWDVEFVSMVCKMPADPVSKNDGPLFWG